MGDARHGLPVERARRHRQFQKRQVFDPFDPFDEFSSLLGITPKPTSTTKSNATSKSSTTSNSSTSLTSKSSSSSSTPTPTSTPKPVPTVSTTPFTPKAPVPPPAQSTGSSVDANAKPDDNNSGGIQPGILGAIGAVAGVVVLVILFLVVRKIRIAKRREARSNWNPPIIEPLEKPSDPAPAPIPPASYNQFMPGQGSGSVNKPLPSGPAYPAPAVGYNTQPSYGGYAQPPYQPPVGYAQQPQSNIFASSAYAPTDLAGPVPIARTTPPPPSSYVSVVKRTFIPSLPDELSISTGESVRVLSSYDDGWALCEKITNPGEKGVVPLECLSEATGASTSNANLQPTAPTQEGARLSRRASSLNPAQPGHY